MLNLVQSSLSRLAPAELRVAELVIADPRNFARLPVQKLAILAKVSSPTVVRFCRTMGCEGLSDFKIRLISELGEGVPFIHRSVGEKDSTSDLVGKVVDNTVSAFISFRNEASAANIERASRAITDTFKKGRRLEFFGVGNSGIVAEDARLRFFRMGFHTNAQCDGHLQVVSASLAQRGDCIVVISNSGRTRDLLDACSIAREKGAICIVITASGSPLSEAGDIHLAANHPESYEHFSPMVSRLLHLLILDILSTSVALRIGSSRLQPGLRAIRHNLLEKRYV